MSDLLLWLYLINSVLLIDHEIDSAFWKEWELFRLPGGITGFLILHIPLLLIILWGMILVADHSPWGHVFSLILSFGGLFAFFVHTYFLRKGRPQFDNWISKGLLGVILIVSLVQAGVTVFEISHFY